MDKPSYFHVVLEHAFLGFRNEEPINQEQRNSNKFPHYPNLHKLLNFMAMRGFQVGRDPQIEARYPILTKDHWYGRKGDLEFKAHRYPAGWQIEFFQNLIIKNPNGGFYDFDKYAKMPYLIKLLFRNELRYITKFLLDLGYQDHTKQVHKRAEERIKQDYIDSWHHEQSDMNFDLYTMPLRTNESKSNITDRDGKLISNGEIKYYRGRGGHLLRGRVFHRLNNMWFIMLNEKELDYAADFELFDPTPEDFAQRRKVWDNKPKEYLNRRAEIEKTKTSELVSELRRRGIKISA